MNFFFSTANSVNKFVSDILIHINHEKQEKIEKQENIMFDNNLIIIVYNW